MSHRKGSNFFLSVLMFHILLVSTGCGDRIDLDKSLIVQVNALDSSKNGKIQSYYVAPVFPEIEGKSEIILSDVGNSVRHNRRLMVSQSVGEILLGKVQVILFTDKFLKAHTLFDELNVYFRDPINPNNALLLYTEAPLETILTVKKRLRPMVSTYITELVEFAQQEGLSVKTTLERLNYLYYNKGMTAAVTEIGIEKGHLRNKGTILLSDNGKFGAKLSNSHTSLLVLLRNETKFPLNYSFKLKDHVVSFDILRAKTSIKTSYQDGVFKFKVNIPVSISLTEYTLHRTFIEDKNAILQAINEEFTEKLTGLIKLCQKKGVDPVGFGMHARAYQYHHFKQVEDNWTKAFAEAEITVNPVISIKRFGIVK